MKTYVYVNDGVVWEIVRPMVDGDENEIPLSSRYTSSFCSQCVDVTGMQPPPQENWTAIEDGGQWSFSAPSA
jgi:hypothetical protein